MSNLIIRGEVKSKIALNSHTVFSITFVFINSGFALTTGYSDLNTIVGIFYLFIEWLSIGIRINYKNKGLHFLAAFICLIGMSSIVNVDFRSFKEYIRIVVLMIMAYHISISYSWHNLAIAFCIAMKICVIASLILFFTISFFPGIPFPTVTNGYGVKYYTLIITSINEMIARETIRNSGFFWEAGMFAAFILMWQIIYICMVNGSKQFMWCIIAIITLLTTKSTSGYIYIIIIALLIMISNRGKLKMWQSAVFLIAISFGIYLYINLDSIIILLGKWKPEAFAKLLLNNASVTDRLNNPLADLYVSLSNPFGVGVGDLAQIVNHASHDLFSTGLTSRTSTITYYFAAFGLPCGIIVCIALFRFINFYLSSIHTKIVTLFGIVLLSTSTPLNLNLFFLILLFYGASSSNDNKQIVS